MTILELTNNHVYAVFLIFCRVGTAFMLFPLYSDAGVLPTIRLIMAILVSLMIYPIVAVDFPSIKGPPIEIVSNIFSELAIGMFLGTITRIMTHSIHVLGGIVSTQSGLMISTLFDPTQSSQNTTVGVLLSMLMVATFVALDLDHLLITGLVNSYHKYQVGHFMRDSDFYTDQIIHAVNDAFILGVKLSMPFIISGTLLMVAAGVIARLMPNIQVFFLIMPVQIILSIFILVLTMSYMIYSFLNEFKVALGGLFG